MASELAEIGKRRQLPLKKFGENQIDEFAKAIRSEILTPNSKYAKGYLKSIVSEIRVGGKAGTITGSNADMAGAISGWRPGSSTIAVPRHVSNWRPQQESNLHLALRRRSFYPLNYGG
tara:strand:- start:288 stop:641 length:354 start_codon:yes stop_codon:yes gene_type:complete